MIRPALALFACLPLIACATPQERCQRSATAALRAQREHIAVTRRTIDRGYAIHRQTVPYTYQGTCYHDEISYSCPRTGYRTEETPVAVDISEERRKLARLTADLADLDAQAQTVLQHCAYVGG